MCSKQDHKKGHNRPGWCHLPLSVCCALFLCFLSLAGPAGVERLDALAAVLNDRTITLSDIRLALALDLPPLHESGKTVLDAVIVEWLMYNEASRLPVVSAGRATLEEELSLFKKRFPSDEAYHLFLKSIELEEEELLQKLRRRLLIRRYIDFRFRPFIMVEPIEVDQALRKARAEGEVVELDSKRAKDAVRKALAEEKLDEAVGTWIAGLREKARIQILLSPGDLSAFTEKEKAHD